MKQETKAQTTSLDIKKTYTLKNTNDTYHLCHLNVNHVSAIMALQDKVFNQLSDKNKNFIVMRTQEFFEENLKNGTIDVVGLVKDNKLIAQSILFYPDKNYADKQTTHGLDPEKISMMQGVLVDSDYRGNQLMQKMVKHWVQHSKTKQRPHLISRIKAHNFYSWSIFIEEGLKITSISKDPNNNVYSYNVYGSTHDLTKGQLLDTVYKKQETKTYDLQDTKSQIKLLKKGYVCTALNRAQQTVHFTKEKAPRTSRLVSISSISNLKMSPSFC